MKKYFLLILSVLLICSAKAQPKKDNLAVKLDTLTLDKKFYFEISEIIKLRNQLSAIPFAKIDCNCEQVDFPNLELHHAYLYNFQEDLVQYESLLMKAIDLSKSNWNQNLKQTIANEDLKNRIQNRLIIKDGIAQFSSIILDVASMKTFAESFKGPIPPNFINRLHSLINVMDAMLNMLNITVKVILQDGGTDAITEATGDENWSNFYSAMKAAIDALEQKILAHKEIVRAAQAGQFVDISQYKINLLGAIASVLHIWASNERQRMKKAISDLDEALIANQSIINQDYQRYILKRRLYDQIILLKTEIQRHITNSSTFCEAIMVKRYREPREDIIDEARTFGLGLNYYKNLITQEDYIQKLTDSKVPSVDCNARLYNIAIHDGVGKRYPAEIQIKDNPLNRPKKVLYEGKADDNLAIKLFPGYYDVDIIEDETTDKVFISNTTKIFGVNGNEKTHRIDPISKEKIGLVVVEPFGRVQLEVVDSNGDPHDFGYNFDLITVEQNMTIATSLVNGRRLNMIELDLPANKRLDLSLDYGLRGKNDKGITISKTQINKLRYVYDNDNFTKDEENSFKKENLPSIEATDEINLPIPGIWRGSWGEMNLLANDGERNSYGGSYPSRFSKNKRGYFKLYHKDKRWQGEWGEKALDRKGNLHNIEVSRNRKHISGLYSVNRDGGKGFKENVIFRWHLSGEQPTKTLVIEDIADNKKTNTVTNSSKVVKIPNGWVEGVLYNSNDGSCDDKGRSLVFMHHKNDILNLSTGIISENVIVAPGEKLEVAVPAGSVWLRAFRTAGDSNAKESGTGVAFARMEASNGWWFGTGCGDGSRFPTNCYDGNSNDGNNESCETTY
ncbi:hypothetical protein [Muriicola sp. Z0-33]|uniref:hypothetical protein n=1 Tax=Muriicola sp. Z0-33 TaxID=2816957 RepID=UPI002238105C|nr:hypothetical protein [Muriicola sp. Z0-33]MCW5516171.1 hypothetical protein [Muriicola sp. Z0-33]